MKEKLRQFYVQYANIMINVVPMKSLKAYILLFLGIAWITLNVYFLPFFAWTTGVVWSWLMLHGFVPYRDFVLLRTPFDLFLLAGWSNFFGSSQDSYQLFIYFIFIVIALLVFFLSHRIFPKIQIPSFLFFIIFLFPIFQNTEMGEMLVGLWTLLLLATMYEYLGKKDIRILFLAGIISGLSVITKQNSGGIVIASIGILSLDWFIKKSSFFSLLKSFALYIAGVLLPILALTSYLLYHNALPGFIYYTLELVLGPYRANPLPPGFSIGEGLWIYAAYLSLCVPLIAYRKQTNLPIQMVIFLPFLTVSLLPSLLPAFHSYRTFTAYPLIAIVAGFNICLLINKKGALIQKFVISISLIIFVSLTSRFINSYISQIKDEGFHYKNYIVDYGKTDYQVVEWIKKNTKEDEKITSSTSLIVYLLSNRLPKNKYTFFEPVPLLPYSESSRVFIEDPPRVFVLDNEILETRPDLKKWPFFEYLKNNYKSVALYGTSEIFVLK